MWTGETVPTFWHLVTQFAQEHVYDIYIEMAAHMTWINQTIMKMGGMQACDLVFEETSPGGHFLESILRVQMMRKQSF